MSESKRKPKNIDVSHLQTLIDEGLDIIATDVGYAVAISRAAVAIERKRQVWQARIAVRNAEKNAREKCEQKEFTCKVVNPCGTGGCRFATTKLSKIKVISPGDVKRPDNSTEKSYSIEKVVDVVKDMKNE